MRTLLTGLAVALSPSLVLADAGADADADTATETTPPPFEAPAVHEDAATWDLVLAGTVVQLAHALGPDHLPGETLELGVLGAPALTEALCTMLDQGELGGRMVTVTGYPDSRDLEHVELPALLVVGRAAEDGFARLHALDALAKVVTVSDLPEFLTLGGDVAIERAASPVVRARPGPVADDLAAFLTPAPGDERYARADGVGSGTAVR